MSSKPVTEDDHAAVEPKDRSFRSVEEPTNDGRLKQILADILGIKPEDAAVLSPESGLFGHIPELDSMAVAGLLTEIEDSFDIVIEDDDVDGEMLETYGGLLDFVDAKIADV